jgi:hypothetical protein
MAAHRERYEKHPDLQAYNALERFRAMRTNLGENETLDLDASRALRAAIVEFDPAVHGLSDARRSEMQDHVPSSEGAVVSAGTRAPASPGPDRIETTGLAEPSSLREDGVYHGRSFRPSSPDLATMVDISEPVEAGDVVVLDPDRSGRFRRASRAEDPTVLGVVATDPGLALGTGVDEERAAVASSGLVLCKVDAGYGAIRPGDLLITSHTPGHAMRASDPRLGIVLGKAMESLDTGTGTIRVLVTLR